METYARHYEHALRLLARFGGPATIARSVSEPGPDADFDPSSTTVTTYHYDVTLLETGSTAEEGNASNGSRILTTELVGLMVCADDLVPTTDDSIVTDDGTLPITELVAVGPAPGGRSIVYELVATRS